MDEWNGGGKNGEPGGNPCRHHILSIWLCFGNDVSLPWNIFWFWVPVHTLVEKWILLANQWHKDVWKDVFARWCFRKVLVLSREELIYAGELIYAIGQSARSSRCDMVLECSMSRGLKRCRGWFSCVPKEAPSRLHQIKVDQDWPKKDPKQHLLLG